jgi:hypothetical protein
MSTLRREEVITTLLLLLSKLLLLLKKYERSGFSHSERPVRILSGRSLSDRDSFTLVSDSPSLGTSTLSLYVYNLNCISFYLCDFYYRTAPLKKLIAPERYESLENKVS